LNKALFSGLFLYNPRWEYLGICFLRTRGALLEPSGHNWVEGQGSGPRIDKKAGEEEDQYDAMGNKIEVNKKKKQTAAEARKAKKDRMARRKRGEEVFTDDEL